MRRPESPATSRGRRRLVERCRTVSDLRQAAQRRLPRAIFDFIDGGAEDEATLAGNLRAYKALRFQPGTLNDVSNLSTKTTILGKPSALPMMVAPLGAAGFSWPAGDLAIARGADRFGIPYVTSSTASVALEDLAFEAGGRRFFQCYIFKRREITARLIERARQAAFETLVITVDMPVGGNRERDYRNDFAVPFRFTPRNLIDFARHPGWSLMALGHGTPEIANLREFEGMETVEVAASTVGRNYDPSFDWDDLARLRDDWQGKFVVKGILRGDDAARLADLGADAVVVSNHGGRQLDGALPSLVALPEVRSSVGRRLEVFVDGGIRRGTDIVKALALGADAVLVGRPLLYGLAAGGPHGVVRALEILEQELRRAMQLLGVDALSRIGAELLYGHDLSQAFDPAIVKHLMASCRASGPGGSDKESLMYRRGPR